MIRVAVVDDEPLARSGVVARLSVHGDVALAGEYGDAPAALAGLRARPVDLVVVDVQMPGMSGIDLLAALPQRPLAILLTAHDTFAVQAFALNAVDYLLKPVDDMRFTEALQRARQRLASSTSVPHAATAVQPAERLRFPVRIGRRTVFVDIADVDWIGADGDYAVLHVGARSYVLRESLQRLAAELDPRRFVRVHRSAIVNVHRIAEMQPMTNRDAMLRLHEGTPVRVSRTYVDALLEALRTTGTAPR
ncbi:MAG TPA: LytTR family DNA-binding domain-containing protein [Tahibacter sp.]|uniref:LytR/AlgR family response regulator transcription factor n=1 Tax=Tahibacter sp. TaxID=2056211 RepID=UPI002C8001D1|nr:LytTR family DNA-binding domain-containing protein [Tahibacter sp.]HSX62068.1 LytTR family DNA-binding domain-containing protein [Tahibacter sp.]